jgi:hypothetical protein
VAWKDYHFIFGGKFGAIVRLIIYFVGIVIIARFDDYEWNHRFWDSLADLAWTFGWLILWVELAFGALKMWGPEAWGQQLGSLIATPQSLGQIARAKSRALLTSLLPVFALLAFSLVCGHVSARSRLSSFWMSLTSGNQWESLGLTLGIERIPEALTGAAEIALPFMLIVNLSLRMKWTALPSALGIYVVIQAGFAMLISAISSHSTFSRYDLEAPCKLTLFAILLFLLFRNTHKLLLHRAAEG